MTEHAVPWTDVAEAVATQPTPRLLERLVQLIPDLVEADLWVWDQQHRRLVSVRTDATFAAVGELSDDPRWSHVVALRHLGHALGALSLDARSLGEQEAAALGELVGASMRASGPAAEVLELRGRRQEMALPAELQWALLPPVQLRVGRIEIGAAVEPAYDTGGDVFDYALLGNRLFCAVLDAKGHGLKAALTSTLATAAMRQARRDGKDLAGVAQAVVDSILAAGQDEDFVSAIMAELDIATGRCSWLSAGHLPPLVVRDGVVTEMPLVPTLPLGLSIAGETSSPTVQELSLTPGDSLVLYSDGIIENAMSEGRELIGRERFYEIAARRISEAAAAGFATTSNPARVIVEDLLALTGTKLRDDATLLVISSRQNG